MTTSGDVFVAGAGPAGSLSALLLARRGREVVLADRSEFPRDKVCSCCPGGLALSALESAGLGDLPELHGAPVLKHAVLAAGGRVARILPPAGRAHSRTTLDHALVRAAAEAGVTFRAGLGGSFLTDRLELRSLISNASRIGAEAVVATDAPYRAGIVSTNATAAGCVGLTRLEDGRLDVGGDAVLPAEAEQLPDVGGRGAILPEGPGRRRGAARQPLDNTRM